MIADFSQYHEDQLVAKIQSVLTPDLRKGMWVGEDGDNPMAGHCYAATEALWWMLGASKSGYIPYVLSHSTSPELLDAGETHWFLRNAQGRILDATVAQFQGVPINYGAGKANGMMSNPVGGSKRARTIMVRVQAL